MDSHHSVAVCIVCYNSGSIIEKTLDQIHSISHDCKVVKVFLLDSGSKLDPLPHLALDRWPNLEIFIRSSSKNYGYAEGNNNLLQLVSEIDNSTSLVLVINPDIYVDKSVLFSLIRIHSVWPNLFAVSPLPVSSSTDRKTYSDLQRRYNAMRFLGTSSSIVYVDSMPCLKTIFLPGAFVLFKLSLFMSSGMFDERFFMYLEEIDLFYRMWQRGYDSCISLKDHFVHNAGEPIRHPRKTYYLTRNSLLMARRLPISRLPMFLAGRVLKPFVILGPHFIFTRSLQNIIASIIGFIDGCLGKVGINSRFH
jgi:GT2 family glycosyltransferase